MAIALADLAIATLAQKYPATLTDKDKEKINQNYPEATDELMQERAMSAEGVQTTVRLAVKMAEVAISYTPLSHCFDEVKKDAEIIRKPGFDFPIQHAELFKHGLESGLTPFGVAATLIGQSVIQASKQGVHPYLLARPLLAGFKLSATSYKS